MKLANIKTIAAKTLTAGLLAGALVLTAPLKAEAQRVVIVPAYPHTVYRYGYYDHLRFEQERRREAWVRAHDFHYRYGYGYRGR